MRTTTKRIKRIESKLGHRVAGCCCMGLCGREALEAARKISALQNKSRK